MAKTYGNGAAQNTAIGDISNVCTCDSSELRTCIHI